MNKNNEKELTFQEKIKESVRLLDEALSEYIMPVLEDHEKLCEFVYNNKNSWSGYTKEAYEKSLRQAVACVAELERPIRSLLILDYIGYMELLGASATQFQLFHQTTGLEVSKTLIDKAKKLSQEFPLASQIEEFNDNDKILQGALSRLVMARFEAIKNIHGTPEETKNNN